MPPKKQAKNQKKPDPVAQEPPVQEKPPVNPPQEKPKSPVKDLPIQKETVPTVAIQQPPVKDTPAIPVQEITGQKEAGLLDNTGDKENTEEKDKAGNVIKLNQFNNFVASNNANNTGKPAMSEEEKKKLREMRFSLKNTTENTFEIVQAAEQEKIKLQERAKRFGIVISEEEEAKKKKRAERFGGMATGGNLDNEDLKKVERAKRFGMVIPEVEEEKKKLRAQKFGSEIDAGTFLKDKKIKLG